MSRDQTRNGRFPEKRLISKTLLRLDRTLCPPISEQTKAANGALPKPQFARAIGNDGPTKPANPTTKYTILLRETAARVLVGTHMRRVYACLFCPDEPVSRFGGQIALCTGLWGLCLLSWNPAAAFMDDVDVPDLTFVCGCHTPCAALCGGWQRLYGIAEHCLPGSC